MLIYTRRLVIKYDLCTLVQIGGLFQSYKLRGISRYVSRYGPPYRGIPRYGNSSRYPPLIFLTDAGQAAGNMRPSHVLIRPLAVPIATTGPSPKNPGPSSPHTLRKYIPIQGSWHVPLHSRRWTGRCAVHNIVVAHAAVGNFKGHDRGLSKVPHKDKGGKV